LLEKELLAREIEKIAGQENVKLDEPMKTILRSRLADRRIFWLLPCLFRN